MQKRQRHAPCRILGISVNGASVIFRFPSWVVLATGPNSRVGSGFGSTRNWTVATGLTIQKTRTVGNGAGLPPKTQHLKSTIFAPSKYLSSDRIMTWSVRKLPSFSPSCTSSIQICDRTNKRGVAMENPRYSLKNRLYFTVTQRISVRSQIWMREVKEGLKLHNLCMDHVMIRSELIYLIGAKAVGTIYLEPQFGSNPAKYLRFNVRDG